MAPARTGNPQVQNIPDPTRVGRADQRNEQQGSNDALQSDVLRYDSNFQTYLEQLRQTPELAQILSKTVMLLRGMASTPGLQGGIAQEMARLLDMLRLDREELPQALSGAGQGRQPVLRRAFFSAAAGLPEAARRARPGCHSGFCPAVRRLLLLPAHREKPAEPAAADERLSAPELAGPAGGTGRTAANGWRPGPGGKT